MVRERGGSGSTPEAVTTAPRETSRPRPDALRVLGIVSVLCVLGWAVPALLMAGKGFSVQDEGTYLLSYRWWSSNPYFVSGAQYFYGPVFAALHERINVLRVLRLAMVIATNAWFAVVFVRWLAEHREVRALDGRLSWVAVLTAAGGMAYLWTPLTPGYYDLTADASIGLVALMLSTLRRRPSATGLGCPPVRSPLLRAGPDQVAGRARRAPRPGGGAGRAVPALGRHRPAVRRGRGSRTGRDGRGLPAVPGPAHRRPARLAGGVAADRHRLAQPGLPRPQLRVEHHAVPRRVGAVRRTAPGGLPARPSGSPSEAGRVRHDGASSGEHWSPASSYPSRPGGTAGTAGDG